MTGRTGRACNTNTRPESSLNSEDEKGWGGRRRLAGLGEGKRHQQAQCCPGREDPPMRQPGTAAPPPRYEYRPHGRVFDSQMIIKFVAVINGVITIFGQRTLQGLVLEPTMDYRQLSTLHQTHANGFCASTGEWRRCRQDGWPRHWRLSIIRPSNVQSPTPFPF